MDEDQHEQLAKFLFQQRLTLFGHDRVYREVETKKDLRERVFLRAEHGKEPAVKRTAIVCRIFERYALAKGKTRDYFSEDRKQMDYGFLLIRNKEDASGELDPSLPAP